FRAGVIGDARGVPLYAVHQALEVVTRIGDANHAESGALPQISVVQFRDRHVELGPQAVLQAAQDLPLILQGMRTFDAQLEGEEGNQVSSFAFPVSSRSESMVRNPQLEPGNRSRRSLPRRHAPWRRPR